MSHPAQLLVLFDGDWHLALCVSQDQITRLCFKPLKWLRYVGFAITGAEGTLSLTQDGPPVENYDEIMDVSGLRVYFSPVPVAVDHRTPNDNSEPLSTGSRAFRAKIVARDQRCVISAIKKDMCQACHLVPHSIGNKYFARLSGERRSIDSASDDLEDGHGVRNGLLLFNGCHRDFIDGDYAFLATPNFALSESDVPSSTRLSPPRQALPQPYSTGNGRFTLQWLSSEPEEPLDLAMGHNVDTMYPAPDKFSSWPPKWLFDWRYGAAVMKKWSPPTFLDTLARKQLAIEASLGGEIQGKVNAHSGTLSHIMNLTGAIRLSNSGEAGASQDANISVNDGSRVAED
ncbi:hypothetical protein JAAARDRAFT_196896 [Jaapia argillacea MUCL 33604]|uniref:HNH nuclease domain-containing protein n=1 Tax=Jaapia argillacea MUCL 33604 TaxID=933084 RepID=A0A067PUY9_9AGAM|nr:hypothetical protein JAAARDRAFT_196896 [Jaapia argillacea MUCL 33604]